MPELNQIAAIPYVLLGVSLLLLISVLASKTSEWLGVPALLVFLLVGMLAGSEGPGQIWFDNAYLAQFLGTLALAYILFSGGLETNWRFVRPVLRPATILATLGVLITALLVGLFAVLFLNLSWLEGLLLGSVMSSTDAAAVFSILRSRKASLKGRLRPLLELESGSNDPMAVFLTVTVIALIQNPSVHWWGAIPSFVWQMVIGALAGLIFGKLVVFMINRLRLDYEGLYPVLMLSVVLLIFGATDAIHGNGFLAVYVAGVLLSNSEFLHKRSLVRFHEGIAWLMQIAMFLTLGLLVYPSHLVKVIGPGLLLALFLMVIARPASVMLCMIGSGFTFREKLLTSWVGLRGAVPIVLSTFPLMAGVSEAETIFNLVFFVVIASVLLQGKFLPTIARWLKLDKPLPYKSRSPLEFDHTEPGIRADMVEVEVSAESDVVGKRISELRLPHGLLVALIRREGKYFVPDGGTVLQAEDDVLVLGGTEALIEAEGRFGPKVAAP